MAKYYVYYNDQTREEFCTVYEWDQNNAQRKYCGYIGGERYTHKDLQLDVSARVLINKKTNTKYALIPPRKSKPGLQWESVEMKMVSWEDLGL